jgi:6,7-dimethyl-8-ribityllumazine synthase
MANILVVSARFYEGISSELEKGAITLLEQQGHRWEQITVPGALEIPAVIRYAIESGKYEGYVALGCVIRGETTHYEIVCNESARGLMELAVRHQAAIGNGILTVENEGQAWARARIDRANKGGDAAAAALALIAIRHQLLGMANQA